jgi:sulfopyruvate decarboxylase TPP-binding subunit
MGLGLVGGPQLSGDKVAEELKKMDVTHVVYLADVMCSFLTNELYHAPEFSLVPVCREGEAVPVATGLWMAGQKPVVLHQNSGFLEAGDSVIQVGKDLKVPLLMLIGYRGYRRNRAEMTDPPGIYIEPVLNAMKLLYEVIETDLDIPKLAELQTKAESLKTPVVGLIAWELAW